MEKKLTIIIGIFLAVFLLYNYSIERSFAESRFQDYISDQNIDPDKIASKKTIKNWKMGGQTIFVKYEDDMDCDYIYQYYFRTHRRGENVKYHRMFLEVIKGSRSLNSSGFSLCKYPPLRFE